MLKRFFIIFNLVFSGLLLVNCAKSGEITKEQEGYLDRLYEDEDIRRQDKFLRDNINQGY